MPGATGKPRVAVRREAGTPGTLEHSCQHVPAALICNPPADPVLGFSSGETTII